MFGAVNSRSAEDTTRKYIQSINDKNWNEVIALSNSEENSENVNFYRNESNLNEHVGFFDINTIELNEEYALNDSQLAKYTDLAYYENLYPSGVKGYLIGANLNVFQENKYFSNGLNYFLFIVAQENGEWKEVEFSQGSIDLVNEVFERTVKSEDTKSALKIIQARNKGIILNSSGQVIETNQATKESLSSEKGTVVDDDEREIKATDSMTRPANIKVYRNASGSIDTVDFFDYCKNVLPNEWISSWNAESLKAGAQCVKMVGWYRVYNAKYPGKGYDVKDTTADQVYKPSTEVKSCTDAINAVGGIGLKNSSGNIFYTAYVAGTSGQAGTQNGGEVKQYGTKLLAEQGKVCLDILHYYYDKSTISTGAIATFTY